MTNWVKHPNVEGDGEVVIAGPKGSVTAKMVGGVFAWPDGLPLPTTHKATFATPELIKAQREADVAALKEAAKKLGLSLAEVEQAEEIAEKVEAVEDAAPESAEEESEPERKASKAQKK